MKMKMLALGALAALVVTATAFARPAPQTAPATRSTRGPTAEQQAVPGRARDGLPEGTCQADGTWLFTDPEATLYKTTGAANAIGTHFLNFATGRPVWQFEDGSSVEAARWASASGGDGEHRVAPAEGGHKHRRPRRRASHPYDLGAAAEHLRRRRTGRNVYARCAYRRRLRR